MRNLVLADAANKRKFAGRFEVWKCWTCGKEAPATVHQMRKSYCSTHCMAEGYKVRLKGSNNPNYRDAGWQTCINCGERFQSYAERKYCGMRCRNAGEYRGVGRTRKDANHHSIVDTIRKVGGSVIDISVMGQGAPDLIVMTRKGIQLAEIKNTATSYGRKGLSTRQRKWAELWRGGPVYVLRTDQDAINLVTGNFEALEGIGGYS